MRIKVVNGKIMEDSEWSGMQSPEEFVPNTLQLRELSRDELAMRDRIERREAHKRWLKKKLDEEEARRQALISRDAEIRQQALYNKQMYEAQKYWNIKQAQRKFSALRAAAFWEPIAMAQVQNTATYLDVVDDWSDWANRRAREEAALDVPLDELEREYEAANQNLDVVTEDFYTRASQEEAFFQTPSALVMEKPLHQAASPTVTLQDIFAGLRAFFLKG